MKIVFNGIAVSWSVLNSCCPFAIYLVFRVVFLLLSCKRAYSIFLSFLKRVFKSFPDSSFPITEINEVFILKEFKFFMSDEFTLVDCYFAPILWRLPSIGIKLPLNRHLKPLIEYQNAVFERPGFLDSLSSIERDLKTD